MHRKSMNTLFAAENCRPRGPGVARGSAYNSAQMGWRLRLLLGVLGLVTASVCADDMQTAGKFLVASRDMTGPTFARAVLLMVHHDESGAMGLIVNRPTRLPAAQVLPQLPQLAEYRGPLYLGGPVGQRRIWALLRTDTPPGSAIEILPAIYLTPLSEELVNNLPSDTSSLRLYVGYAGWGPGQLDGEMALGSWHVVPASAALVFSDDPNSIWRQLVPAPRYRVANDLPDGSISPRR
jgi:putative transcriptional regulator